LPLHARFRILPPLLHDATCLFRVHCITLCTPDSALFPTQLHGCPSEMAAAAAPSPGGAASAAAGACPWDLVIAVDLGTTGTGIAVILPTPAVLANPAHAPDSAVYLRPGNRGAPADGSKAPTAVLLRRADLALVAFGDDAKRVMTHYDFDTATEELLYFASECSRTRARAGGFRRGSYCGVCAYCGVCGACGACADCGDCVVLLK